MNTTSIIILIIISILTTFLILAFNLTRGSSPKGKSVYKYQRRNLLTKNELIFYKSLYPIATKKGFILLSKIRLSDLIEPLKGTENRQASLNKINQKHVDFVLCDSTKINPILIIELDDASHDRADRQERDNFVDQALESAGIPILHTRTADKLEENIMMKLSTKKAPRK